MADKEHELGTVVSTPESPTPAQIDFVVMNGKVHRGQFVEIPFSEGIIIGMITNVRKTNKYFERADAVKEFEAQGTKLFEQFPVHDWEYMLAVVNPLGVFSENKIKLTTHPPSPGTKVFNAQPSNIVKFLGLDEEKGLELGEMEFHPVKIRLNMSKLLQKHLAILAMSGAGKSHTVSCLLEEMLERKKENGRMAIVVFDVHGEYTNFAEPITDGKFTDYSGRTRLIRARDLKIGVPKISAGMFNGLIPNASPAQKRELAKAIQSLQQKMKDGLGPYDLNDIRGSLMDELSSKEAKDSVITALIGWIHELDNLKLFGKADNPALMDLIQPGVLTVIDLSDVIHQHKKQVIVSYLTQRIFNERRNKQIPPTAVVLEEAHNFIPQQSSKSETSAKSIMRTIAREGRKFGVSLCLISQRPVQLDTTTLSQCNTQLILRITNPNDLDHIKQSAEGLTAESLNILPGLKVGEGILMGEAVSAPTPFKVRQRKSQPSRHEGSLEMASIAFENDSEKNRKETEDLL